MNKSPFFSILIPTKNRSHLVGSAVQSVLNQDFSDFEIIITDNDDDKDATNVVIRKYNNDCRIKYVRTGGLSMVDNWNMAREYASGKYITVLEDKQCYYQNALSELHKIIKNTTCDVFVWRWDENKSIDHGIGHEDEHEMISSHTILSEYCKGNHPGKMIPRMINSCISNDLMRYIINNNSKNKFFSYYSPDLFSGFLQLAYSDYIFYIKKSYGYMNSCDSNAKNIRKGKTKNSSYFAGNSNFDIKIAVDRVPIKNPCLVHNTIYNDFLSVKEIVNGRLDAYSVSDSAYARICLRDIYVTSRDGGSIMRELSDVFAFMINKVSLNNQIRLWSYWAPKIIKMQCINIYTRLLRYMNKSPASS